MPGWLLFVEKKPSLTTTTTTRMTKSFIYFGVSDWGVVLLLSISPPLSLTSSVCAMWLFGLYFRNEFLGNTSLDLSLYVVRTHFIVRSVVQVLGKYSLWWEANSEVKLKLVPWFVFILFRSFCSRRRRRHDKYDFFCFSHSSHCTRTPTVTPTVLHPDLSRLLGERFRWKIYVFSVFAVAICLLVFGAECPLFSFERIGNCSFICEELLTLLPTTSINCWRCSVQLAH